MKSDNIDKVAKKSLLKKDFKILETFSLFGVEKEGRGTGCWRINMMVKDRREKSLATKFRQVE